MKRFFRRKKKLIIRILILIVFLALIAALVYYVFPKSGIKTFNFINKENTVSDEIEVTIIDEPVVTTSLPEYITDVNEVSEELLEEVKKSQEDTNTLITSTTGINGKSYKSYVENSEKYFITILSNDSKSLTIMLTNKSEALLTKKTKAKIGVDYPVSGLKEKIVGVYNFTYSNYKYPILLLLSSSGKLYYVDIESAITTGKFKANGPIKNVSNIYKICDVEVNDGKKTYKSAVLTDVDGIGYEFTLDMIGK